MKEQDALEIVKFLGLEQTESVEDAKEKFQQNWTKSDEVSSKIGKLTGTIANVTRKAFEPFGVTLSEDDFKDKKIEDVIRGASEKAKTEFEKQRNEWEQRASGNNSEELIKDWEKKYKGLEKKYTEIDSAREEVANQFESYKVNVATEKRKNKIDSLFEREMSSIKLDPAVNEYTLRGFKSAINDKYEIDLEENDSPIIKDKATGERVKSKDKAGKFLNISEVLVLEASSAGIIQKNPHSGKPAPSRNTGGGSSSSQPDEKKSRGLHPSFLGM